MHFKVRIRAALAAFFVLILIQSGWSQEEVVRPEQKPLLERQRSINAINYKVDPNGNVTSLHLANAKYDSDTTNDALADLRKMQSLRHLSFGGFSRIDDGLFSHLKELRQLESVEFSRCGSFTGSGCKELVDLPSLKRISFSGCFLVDDRALPFIARCKNLESLNLRSTKVTDQGIENLQNHAKLKSINLAQTEVSNKGIEYLGTIPTLEEIVISGNTSNLALKGMRSLVKLKKISTDHRRDTKTTCGAVVELFLAQGRTIEEALKAVGASIGTDEKGNAVSLFLSPRFHLTQKLESYQEATVHITDDVIPYLNQLPKLQFLRLESNRLSGEAISGLKLPPTLNSLSLYGMTLNDDSLKILDNTPNLESLHLSFGVIGQDFEKIGNLKRLRELSIRSSQIADDGVIKLATASSLERLSLPNLNVGTRGYQAISTLQNLKELNLAGAKNIRDGAKFIGNLMNLEDLDLRASSVVDSDLPALAKLTRLSRFRTDNTKVTGSGRLNLFVNLQKRSPLTVLKLEGGAVRRDGEENVTTITLSNRNNPTTDDHLKLLQGFKLLTRLRIYNQKEISDAGIKHIEDLPRLEQVFLYRCDQLSDQTLATLAKIKSLKQIQIRSDNITPAAAKHLVDLPLLESLSIYGKQIDAKALEIIRKLLPNCKVN